MGQSNNHPVGIENTNDVIICANYLKHFFNRYYDSPEKADMLKYVPIGYNYTEKPTQNKHFIFAEPFWFSSSFIKSDKPLSHHVSLEYFNGCKIIISKEYNQKLIDFAENNKTNNVILREYYEKKKSETSSS